MKLLNDESFNFLQLPLEIKLQICRYLSSDDINNLASISEDYKTFVEQYFVDVHIQLPEDILVCSETENRYVLSINVDFTTENFEWKSLTMRARTAVAVRLLNLTELKHLVLSTKTYNFEDRRVFFGNHIELKTRPLKGICPWFSEISMLILKSAFYLHSIDMALFKCQDSLIALETLADNASFLRSVTLRNPKEYTVFPDLATKDRDNEFYSLTKMLARLLTKSAVTLLHLIDFHSNPIYRVWWTPGNPLFGGNFLQLSSRTLQKLVLTSTCYGKPPQFIGEMNLRCPQLTQMLVTCEQQAKPCFYHFYRVAPGIDDSLIKNSLKFERFNGLVVKKKMHANICNQWSCPYRH